MTQVVTTIHSERLDLIPMTPAFLQASLDGDLAACEARIGLDIPADWLNKTGVMRRRLTQLQADPTLQPWLIRAVSLRQERVMVGYIGFHDQPGAAYLNELAPGGAEFGYTIFPRFRRNGYAREASLALMQWAHTEHGVTRFVVSISPTNTPSLNLAHQLGFTKIGAHIDEEDGPEDIFELKADS